MSAIGCAERRESHHSSLVVFYKNSVIIGTNNRQLVLIGIKFAFKS
jgi:hypothetical protein